MEDGRAGVGGGQRRERTDDLRRGVLEHLLVLGAEKARCPLEVLGVGQGLDEGEVVELDRVGLDIEAALLEFVAGAQIDHRADAELAQDGQIGLGQLAQAVGPEQHPPAGALTVDGGVAAEVTEVDGPLELDDADRPVT